MVRKERGALDMGGRRHLLVKIRQYYLWIVIPILMVLLTMFILMTTNKIDYDEVSKAEARAIARRYAVNEMRHSNFDTENKVYLEYHVDENNLIIAYYRVNYKLANGYHTVYINKATGDIKSRIVKLPSAKDEKNIITLASKTYENLLDPAEHKTKQSSRYLFSGLFRLDHLKRLEKDLVHEYSVSDDDLTWTFVLRDDAKWSDGSEITAEDFVYSWSRLREKDYTRRWGAYYMSLSQIENSQYVFQPIEGIDSDEYTEAYQKQEPFAVNALDKRTLEVRLMKANPDLLRLLSSSAFSVVDQRTAVYLENPKGEEWIQDNYKDIKFSGPYMVKYMDGDVVITSQNPFYCHKYDLRFEGIKYVTLDHYQEQIDAFLKGNLDVLSQDDSGMDDIKMQMMNEIKSENDIRRAEGIRKERLLFKLGEKERVTVPKSIMTGITDGIDSKFSENHKLWLSVYYTLMKADLHVSEEDNLKRQALLSFIPTGYYFDEHEIDESSRLICDVNVSDEVIDKLWQDGLSDLGLSELEVTITPSHDSEALYDLLKPILESNLQGIKVLSGQSIFKSSIDPNRRAYSLMDTRVDVSEYLPKQSLIEIYGGDDYKDKGAFIPMYQHYDCFYATYKGKILIHNGIYKVNR